MQWLNRSRWRRTPALAVAVLALVLISPPAIAAASSPSLQMSQLAHPFTRQLLAKAVPDECFDGIGNPYPAGPPCAQGQPKVNQSYVWGLAKVANKVWFGTGANVNCLVNGATLNILKPSLNADEVCEYGQSQIVKANPGLPGSVGDQRQPQIFYYDTYAHKLVDRTALVLAASTDDANRLRSTVGLRAGGAFGGVVLFGGPSVGNSINLFAFNGNTGDYLGSTNLTAYGNIRHFTVAGNALYAGVGVGRNGDSGGHVLRWAGSLTAPFSFVDVADLPAQAADLTFFAGRVFVSTWAHINATTPEMTAGVWMSPPLSANSTPELDTTDATAWSQVWSVTQYEPDPVIRATYGLGGLAGYNGYLYWGTMHVPMKSTSVIENKYPATGPALRAEILNSQRAASIFRGKDFGTPHQKVDLLYGETQLQAYDPTANGGVGAWSLQPTGYTPMFGASGFGNPYNNYEWIMTVTAGRLFVGTMDWSYLAKDILPPGQGHLDPSVYGGELWMFDCPTGPAKAVDTTGVGNYLNYGVRNMVGDHTSLYLGMANPMNLRTDPTDDIPEGGWELIKMDVH